MCRACGLNGTAPVRVRCLVTEWPFIPTPVIVRFWNYCNARTIKFAEGSKRTRVLLDAGLARQKVLRKKCASIMPTTHDKRSRPQGGFWGKSHLGEHLGRPAAASLSRPRSAVATSVDPPPYAPANGRLAGLVFLLGFRVLAGACQRHGVGVF